MTSREPSDAATPADAVPREVVGLAALTHGAYAGMDLQPVWSALLGRVRTDPYDSAALMDMSILLQLTGNKDQGLDAQRHALALHQVYVRPGAPDGLRLLAIMTPGDFMTNTPLDFLLEGSGFNLIESYVGEGDGVVRAPDHDVAFVAIGESDATRAVLRSLEPVLANWPRPVINRNVEAIASLGRDAVSMLFAGSSRVVAPPTVRVEREAVQQFADGAAGDLLGPDGVDFPVIIRPVGSHAGQELSLTPDAAALSDYLRSSTALEFFVAPFVDYAGADGLFRKYRIALIDGVPYLSHLAISEHWMVHYLNSGMADSAAKRAEEAEAMAGFETGFAARHKAALEELQQRVGLDYFAIDAAETPDGRLLLFEADVAMIVHSMDEPDLFPYKVPQMKKVFAAFQDLLARRAAAG
jgi:hypothetical protein